MDVGLTAVVRIMILLMNFKGLIYEERLIFTSLLRAIKLSGYIKWITKDSSRKRIPWKKLVRGWIYPLYLFNGNKRSSGDM
jgi:hypothetical protein